MAASPEPGEKERPVFQAKATGRRITMDTMNSSPFKKRDQASAKQHSKASPEPAGVSKGAIAGLSSPVNGKSVAREQHDWRNHSQRWRSCHRRHLLARPLLLDMLALDGPAPSPDAMDGIWLPQGQTYHIDKKVVGQIEGAAVHFLNLSGYGLGDDFAGELADVLSRGRFSNLVKVDLSSNRMTMDGIGPVLQALPLTVRDLRLSGNQNLNAAVLCSHFLVRKQSPEHDRISKRVTEAMAPSPLEFDSNAVFRIAGAPPNRGASPKTRKSLIMRAGRAGGWKRILKYDENNATNFEEINSDSPILPAVETLGLDDCALGASGLTSLLPLLRARYHTITTLKLANNKITSGGGAILGASIAGSGSALRHLSLSWNQLGSDGVALLLEPLAKALRLGDWTTAQLISLDLNYNNIGSAAGTSSADPGYASSDNLAIELLAELLRPTVHADDTQNRVRAPAQRSPMRLFFQGKILV